jgi:hypothetical protein
MLFFLVKNKIKINEVLFHCIYRGKVKEAIRSIKRRKAPVPGNITKGRDRSNG